MITLLGSGLPLTSMTSLDVTFTTHWVKILLFSFTWTLIIPRSASLLEHKPELTITLAILSRAVSSAMDFSGAVVLDDVPEVFVVKVFLIVLYYNF